MMLELKFVSCFLILKVIFIAKCQSANILCLIPGPSFSRQQSLLALSQALAESGHNLTVMTMYPKKVPIHQRVIDISFLYKDYSGIQSDDGFTLQKKVNPFKFVYSLTKLFGFVSSCILGSPQIKQFIKEIKEKNIKYDLIIIEALFHTALLGFADITGNPPIIGVVTMTVPSPIDSWFGNPLIPSYIPSMALPYSDKMSFLERVENSLMAVYYDLIMNNYNNKHIQQRFMEEHFGKLKYTVGEMEKNLSLLLVTTDLATRYAKPDAPNIIYIGPLHISSPEELPKDVKEWMDEAEDGVVYFSFGSNTKGTSVPEEIRAIFMKAFLQFPKVRFLWKWEANWKLPGQPDNVLTRKWLPQQSVLAHPNMKIFISQVGLQSLQEAINYKVPILGFPLHSDQHFNAKKLSESGAGLQLNFNDITYENVYKRLNEMLSNSSFKENMDRLSVITKDKPMSGVDTATWWIEYILRHKGAPHLRPASSNLYWFQHYMLDVVLFLLAALLFSSFLIYFFVTKLICSFYKPKVKTN